MLQKRKPLENFLSHVTYWWHMPILSNFCPILTTRQRLDNLSTFHNFFKVVESSLHSFKKSLPNSNDSPITRQPQRHHNHTTTILHNLKLCSDCGPLSGQIWNQTRTEIKTFVTPGWTYVVQNCEQRLEVCCCWIQWLFVDRGWRTSGCLYIKNIAIFGWL